MVAIPDTKLERAHQQMKGFYSVDMQRSLYIAAREAESDRVSMLSAPSRGRVGAKGIQESMLNCIKNET